MLRRGLVLLLLLYVVLDFANPLLPGAVSFDAADSVEGVHAERRVLPQPLAIPASDPAQDVAAEIAVDVTPAALDRPATPVRWLFAPRRVSRPPDPPPGADDH